MSEQCCVQYCNRVGDIKMIRGEATALYICTRHWPKFFGHRDATLPEEPVRLCFHCKSRRADPFQDVDGNLVCGHCFFSGAVLEPPEPAEEPAEKQGPETWVCSECGFSLAYGAETTQWCNVCWAVRQGIWRPGPKPAEEPAEKQGPGRWLCAQCGAGILYFGEGTQSIAVLLKCPHCGECAEPVWKPAAKPAEEPASEPCCADARCAPLERANKELQRRLEDRRERIDDLEAESAKLRSLLMRVGGAADWAMTCMNPAFLAEIREALKGD